MLQRPDRVSRVDEGRRDLEGPQGVHALKYRHVSVPQRNFAAGTAKESQDKQSEAQQSWYCVGSQTVLDLVKT